MNFILKGFIVFHLQIPYLWIYYFLLYPNLTHKSKIKNWNPITKKDWMSKLFANPFENQNPILSILANINIAQTSMEKVPTERVYFINEYCE